MSVVRDTKGVTFNNNVFHKNSTITIRCTFDEIGKTLSLADENRNIMLMVEWEDVEKAYKEEKKRSTAK